MTDRYSRDFTNQATTFDLETFNRAVNRAGSQSELARKLGVSRGRVGMWRTRGRLPIEFAVKIEVMTGISREKMLPWFPWVV